jgi:ATP-dependent DNA helicase RecG
MKKEPIVGEKYTPRELQEFAVAEMYKSIPEHRDKADPKVGVVLATADGVLIAAAHRGELRKGDHAEFTVLERKCSNQKLDDCMVYATLEPCAPGARKKPKLSCSERVANARIQKVYMGIQDPYPTVAGKGERFLRENGIEIEYFDKDLQDEIYSANNSFIEQAKEEAKKADIETIEPKKDSFETGLVNFDMTDFSEDALQLYIDKTGIDYKFGSEDFNRLLAKWDFIEIDEQKHARPTGWGILLFGKRPTDKFSQARIKFTVKEKEGVEPKIKDFTDALVKVIPQIEEYLSYIFPKTLDRGSFEHKELTEISIKLLREAIVNAIVHRDYSITEAQILIDISPKEIVIKSPGAPIVSFDKLKRFVAPTVSRNPKLADVYYNMDYIERRGLGMEEIQKFEPKPVYSIDEVYTVLTITRDSLPLSKNDSLTSTISKDEQSVYDFIKQRKKVMRKEISENLSWDDRKVQRVLKQLKGKGLIRTEGGTRTKQYLLL